MARKLVGLAALAATLAASTASVPAMARDVRPTAATVVDATASKVLTVGRAGAKRGQESNLFGAPLLIVLLGAVAVTIGTIVIVDNDDDEPTSPA